MNIINLLIWSAGLLLQAILLALLFWRGLARRLPVFTLILAFYVARSIALFSLYGHISREGYSMLFEFMGVADICLQTLLAAVIAIHFFRQRGLLQWRYATKVGVVFLLGLIAAAAAAYALPVRGHAPVDRGSAFVAFLMILLILAMIATRTLGPHFRVAAGFAVFGLAGIVTDLVRRYAAFHHQAILYAASSYVESATYIAIVLYWIFSIKAVKAHSLEVPGIAIA
jgi:hypothetical protein